MSESKGSSDELHFSYKIIQRFNIDGLIIEVIDKNKKLNGIRDICDIPQAVNHSSGVETSRLNINNEQNSLREKQSSRNMICSMCLDVVKSGDEVILACQDVFCRACLITAIHSNENDAIYCPSKFTDCGKIISDDEIKSVIGAVEFQALLVDRLDSQLSSLASKDENAYQSIVNDYDNLMGTPGIQASDQICYQYDHLLDGEPGEDFSSPFVVKSEPDACMTPVNTTMLPRRHICFNDSSKSAQKETSARDDHELSTVTKENPIFIKQEHNNSSSSKQKMELSNNDRGAAGLWARNLCHSSFQGTLTPVIKQEPVTRPLASLQQMHRDKVRFHAPSLITNGEEFVCSVCEMFVIEEQGVVLKSCRHSFCRDCLLNAINRSKTPQVPCPMKIEACDKEIRDEEVQALMSPEDYQKFLEKCFNQIANESHQEKDMALKLLQLESLSSYEFVENQEMFECAICLTDVQPGDGLMLKNCLHEYCKICLAKTIELSDDLEVPCPFVAEDGKHCEGFLQDCELRSLITEAVYGAHLEKSLARAEAVIQNSIHCKTPDCPGWAEFCDGALIFLCPLCKKNNCIKCKVIHEGKTCQEYFYDTNADARKTRDDVLTETQVKQLIQMKQAMLCPGCGVIIQKTVGCNHMTCSRCKREFQWLGHN